VSSALLARRAAFLLLSLILMGGAFRLYDVGAPWKTRDHYNFGGIWTTAYAECLRTTPIEISRGVAHLGCGPGENLNFYRAHSPSPLFLIWAWTSVFGTSETAHRTLIWLFSMINVVMVLLIARGVFTNHISALAAGAAQSLFLGGLYFGTHLDFIGEPTITFVLLSAHQALKGRIGRAIVFAVISGLVSWPGFIMLATLLVDAAVRRNRRDVILASAGLAFGLVVALALMMWLHQTSNIIAFLSEKLFRPGYVRADETGLIFPLLLLKNIISSLSRLMGPALLGLGLVSIFWQLPSRACLRAAWLTGGTGVLYTLAGAQYHMVHVYLYLFWLPGLALLLGSFGEPAQGVAGEHKRARFGLMLALVLGAVALYPYGIFKSNTVHDVLNSGVIIGSGLALLIQIYRSRQIRPALMVGLIAVAGGANVSQMINYRNEPDTERSFCEQARRLAIQLPEGAVLRARDISKSAQPSDAKRLLYCRGLRIDFTSSEGSN
jgi:hypothetical protein